MNGVVSAIAASAGEQAVSLKEVSIAADNMDKVTQQNAAMVEESTAAAQTLTTETKGLAALVGRFRARGLDARTKARPRNANDARPTSPPRSAVRMRPVGNGGAAVRAAPVGDAQGWEEF